MEKILRVNMSELKIDEEAFFTKKKLPPHNHTFDIPERELDTVFNF